MAEMSNEEFYRRKFKIQDVAIREILSILKSPNLETTKMKWAENILNSYTEELKELFNDVEKSRFD